MIEYGTLIKDDKGNIKIKFNKKFNRLDLHQKADILVDWKYEMDVRYRKTIDKIMIKREKNWE